MQGLTNPIIILALASGCGHEPDADGAPGPETREDSGGPFAGFEPGDSSDLLNDAWLEYDTVATGGDTDTQRFGALLCEHARLGGTTLIAEVLPGVRNITEGVRDCERDYSQPAKFIPLRVHGNAAGERVPAEMETTFVFLDWNLEPPSSGDKVLVTLKEDADEWFWVGWMPLEVTSTAAAPIPRPAAGTTTDLPPTFSTLSTELRAKKADLHGECGGSSPGDEWGWPRYVRDPSIWYGTCDDGGDDEPIDGYPARDSGG